MKITYNWLKEFIETGLTPEELHKKFFTLGIGVESFGPLYSEVTKVVISKLLKADKHPDADKLTVCEVDTGSEILKIVCGAKNHKAGYKVAVAVNGATLPGGIKISKVVLRGIESNGMICSEKELGLADSSAGVMILPADAPIGKDFKETYGLNDWLYEIEVMPNKPEYLGIIGIARVLSAALKKPMKVPEILLKEDPSSKVNDLAKVKILDKDLCPRYSARVLSGVKLAPSPVWMQVRLRSVGIRAINNLVDVTNYVLLETGHPLHAFDYELIKDKTIIVRKAKDGEEISTLDGVKRKLDKDMLVIADTEKAVALAGIMGGQVSEINEKTVNVLLESAYFEAVNIRKTSKKLGLMTEASYRFERGADYNGIIYALNRTAQLINGLAGGKIASGCIDEYPEQIKQIFITTRFERVNKLLGTNIQIQEMLDISKGLGFIVDKTDNKSFTVIVPSFRTDLTREIDMIEEIAVIHGYDKIQERFPTIKLQQQNTSLKIDELAKQSLVKRGLNEVINYTFMNKSWFDRAGISADNEIRTEYVNLMNHLIEDWNILRSTLLPNLLNNVRTNTVSHGNKNLKIFEVGKIFRKIGNQYIERYELGIIITGNTSDSSWLQKPEEAGFFYLKGILEGLFCDLNVKFEIREANNNFYDKTSSVELLANGEKLGSFGEINKKLLKMHDIKDRVFYAEVRLQELEKHINIKKNYRDLPRFPSNKRDISFIVDLEVCAGEIKSFIENIGAKNLEKVEIIDFYKGENVESGKKSVTYSLTYRDAAKTLTDEEVDTANKPIAEKVIADFKAEIRQQ
ncbi:MAG: phenylalanine--tRNA ligase subunit beta [Candidatus Firestonebacteria bacterium RifOxyC12_full_39_7]|nr:MAG: phenylalanine--tRNA ligase subunit beta [Candidatus Firestonebacteria bacterium RifOxyC12_full_39_7]